MTYPAYLREKALALRTDRHLSIDEIAARLALPKTTIYYWVKEVPLGRPRRNVGSPGNQGMQRKYRRLRERAYAEGAARFPELAQDPTFRDFVCLYIAEGYKRDRNRVALCNSDPAVIRLAHCWILRFAANPVGYSVQYHADQNLAELCRFWGDLLSVTPESIRMQRKSNSRQLAGRQWRSLHGVLTVYASDTLFRARLQAWMDSLQEQWLDSLRSGA